MKTRTPFFSAPFWILLVLAGGLLIGTSFYPAIFDDNEGQYAGASREMLARGDWLVPTNNELPRIQKPALQYWLMMGCMKLFGVGDFAARLPNALGALGCVMAAYAFAWRIARQERPDRPRDPSFPSRVGGLAGGLLVAMFGFFIFSRLIMPEAIFSAFIAWTIYCFAAAWDEPDRRRWLFTAAWILMGLACFSKGIHGALWPLGSAGLCALIDRPSRSFWRGLISPSGIALFLLILLPWYFAVEIRLPGFWKAHFGDEQVALALDHRSVPTSEQVPLLTFILQHLLLWSPPLLLAPAGLAAWRHDTAGTRSLAAKLLACWFALTFLTSCFSARQDYYTLSVMPAVAVGIALLWLKPHRSRALAFLPFVCMTAAGLIGLIASFWLGGEGSDAIGSSATLTQRGHMVDAMQGLSPSAWALLLPALAATSASLFLGGLAGGWCIVRQKHALAALVLSLTMLVPLASAAKSMAVLEDYFSLVRTANWLDQHAPADAWIVYHGEPNLCSSLYFYLPRTIRYVGARVDAEFGPRDLRLGRDLYLDEQALRQAWQSPRTIFLITEESEIPAWQTLLHLAPPQTIPLTKSGTRILLSNFPR